jgi:hypothetical protein
VSLWAEDLMSALNLRNPFVRNKEQVSQDYQKNSKAKRTWPVRKMLELALASRANSQSSPILFVPRLL